MSLQNVSNILWRQRNLLEMLVFKLEEEHLLLAAGKTRWIAAATREAEMVLDEVRQTELERASLIESLAPALGLKSNPSLRQLCEKAPSPWAELFEDHRQAFMSLTEEIEALARSNRELLSRASMAVSEVLSTLSDDEYHMYSPGGRVMADAGPVSRFIDRSL